MINNSHKILTYLGNHTKNLKGSLLSKLNVKNFLLYNEELAPSSLRLLKMNNRFLVGARISYHTGNTNQLSYYIAGLIEGDGSIILRKGDR